jgi:hypothetical protein
MGGTPVGAGVRTCSIVATLICISLLGGCANLYMSSEELHASPHQKGSISVAGTYPVVFANITASANECFPSRSLNTDPGYLMRATARQMSVTSAELEPGKLGRIEIKTTGIASDNVFASIDIRAIPSGTEVDYYIGQRFFGTYDNSSSFLPLANAWARGDASKCG